MRALDALSEGLAFFDLTGVLLHSNRALARALEEDPESERLQAEIQHFADSLCGLVYTRERLHTEVGAVEELAMRNLSTSAGEYRLRGSYIGFDLFGRGRSLLITLEPPQTAVLTEEALRQRFALTRKEACIAHLLAQGKSNQEIARALFISPRTAHHHTQHIFQKLAVHSRTEVAAKVLRG